MATQSVNKKEGKGFWKMMQMAGLALSIPFEIAAGPFIGYFIGAYLRDKFGIHVSIMYLFILMGFVASITNIVAIFEMMIKINKKYDPKEL